MEVETLIDVPEVYESIEAAPALDPTAPQTTKKPRKARAKAVLEGFEEEEPATSSSFRRIERPLGTTNLPLARIQKIMKADKDLGNVGKEAVFLAAVATEEFMGRFARMSYQEALRNGRTSIQYKDVAQTVKQNGELHFLREIIPMPVLSQDAKEKARQKRDEREALRRKEREATEVGNTAIGQAMIKAGAKVQPKKGTKANTLAPAETANGASSSSVGVSPVGTDDGAASSSHAPKEGGEGTTPISAEVERLAFGDDDEDEEMGEA